MERKGIRTEREISIGKLKIQSTSERNRRRNQKITGWLSDFKDRLKTAYQEHKEETKLSVENESGLLTSMNT